MRRNKSVGSQLPTGAACSLPVIRKMLGLSPPTLAIAIHVVNHSLQIRTAEVRVRAARGRFPCFVQSRHVLRHG
jgi:hypothetical protein